jgi:hypothetical protein
MWTKILDLNLGTKNGHLKLFTNSHLTRFPLSSAETDLSNRPQLVHLQQLNDSSKAGHAIIKPPLLPPKGSQVSI